ncbi:secreted protein [sediment metagenome]|uniref:Secreted protein n=1 Tax=sediment metagenome TaxID=749907 RepID=D9PHD8_9ZZZZ
MSKKLLSLLFLLPVITIADSYSENLMVITANTMEKKCTNTPHVVFQGKRIDYAQQNFEISKGLTDAALVALNSKAFIEGSARSVVGIGDAGANMAKGLKEGLAVGVATVAVGMAVNAAISDNEYLYVTECNEGDDRTRLMTLVVSNTMMNEDVWIKFAKEDQEKALR